MEHEGFTVEKEKAVATLTLNRPEKFNALTRSMIVAISSAITDIGKDNSTRVLIITGTGRGFCSGLDVINDLPTLGKMTPREMLAEMKGVASAIHSLPQPTIAAVNGVAAGGGFALAMLCDMRIGSEKARFTSGYIRIGLTPDIGLTYSLPRLVGSARAMEILTGGDSYDAGAALSMGLLNRVVPEGELMKASRELAARIAGFSPGAIELTKEAVRRSPFNNLGQQQEFEVFAFYTCLQSEDHRKAVKAFLEKSSR